jgi:hypothetical protein
MGVVGLALLAPGVASAGTLDQQQADGSGPQFLIYPGESVAQTFTAGLSGGIDQVDLYLGKISAPTAPLNVEIRNVSAGDPGSLTLATASVPASSVPGTAVFVPISFTTHASVAPGTQYAIVASSSTTSGNEYTWSRGLSTSDPYPGGVLFVSPTSSSGPWTPSPTVDMAFKTYVAQVMTTTGTTPTAPTGQRAAALKKCKKKHPHKAKKKCKKKANRLPV